MDFTVLTSGFIIMYVSRTFKKERITKKQKKRSVKERWLNVFNNFTTRHTVSYSSMLLRRK
ncbi:hypothetical protein D3C71_186630 [compost metagenome]